MRSRSGIQTVLLLATAATTVVTPSHGQNAAQLKAQETLMGPMLTGPGITPRIFMSEDGEHLAIVTPKGSRQVVLLDGVEGPVFDEIPSMFLGMAQIAVQFSPTGGHSAYLGRRGGDLIAVVDGKEAVTVATSQARTVSGSNGWQFWFNRDGSHLAYAGHNGQAWVMVSDGVKSAEYREIDLTQTVLNGKRLAYVAQTADQQWHAVVDGKTGPGYISIASLKVTPDGLRYAYVAQPAGSQNALAVVDGVVQGPMFRGINDLDQALDGRVAYVAPIKTAPGASGGGVAVLMAGGVAVPGSCGTGQLPYCLTFNNRVGIAGTTPERRVAWNPDGKGFAYIKSNDPDPGVVVMANGKAVGPTYTSAHQLQWSADGSRFAYLGLAPAGRFPVVDGEELVAVGDLKEFQFSPDGKRYGFVSYGPKGFSVVVDGKEQPVGQGYNPQSFQWSPDGKHFAYGMQSSVNSFGLVVDGVAKPALLLGNFFALNPQRQPQISFPPIFFSPDGNHMAYVGRRSDGTGKAAVFVDGASYEGPTPSYTFPSWSPDSKHFATVTTTGQGWTAMIDGKVGPYYQALLQHNVASCRFVNDRTYRFYGIKGGQIYRVTLEL